MRDPAGECAERLQLLCLPQIRFELAALLFTLTRAVTSVANAITPFNASENCVTIVKYHSQ